MCNGPALRSLGNSERLGWGVVVESGKSFPPDLMFCPHTPQYTLPTAYPQEIETLISVFVLEMRLWSLVSKVRLGFWRFQCRYCGSTVTVSELTLQHANLY
jgi:hypothetical protein